MKITLDQMLQQAFTAHQKNKFEEKEYYKKVLESKPKFAMAHNNMGIIRHKLKRLGEAETSYKKAIEIKPNYAEAYNNLSNTQSSLGKFEESLINCNKALSFKPDLPEAHSNLVILLKQNEFLNITKKKNNEEKNKKDLQAKINSSKLDIGTRLLFKSFISKTELIL